MTDSTTLYLGLTLPTVGADNNTWGSILDADLVSLDALWLNIGAVAFGTAATKAVGTSGGTVPLCNGANTWAAPQTFSSGLTSTGDITVNRAGAPTTGYVFYGNGGGTYFGFDGSNFVCNSTGHITGPAGGFVGSLTGNASTASVAASANTVPDGVITPAKLSTGGPTWDGAANLFVPAGGGFNLGTMQITDVTSSKTFFFAPDTYLQWVPGSNAIFLVKNGVRVQTW